jgi:hypothetical protein
LDDLLAGYRRLRTNDWLKERERFEALAEFGQSPHSMGAHFDIRHGVLFLLQPAGSFAAVSDEDMKQSPSTQCSQGAAS